MLYLLKQEDGSNFFYLISGKEYVVGRKNADIILANDQSISRQHAIIKVQSDSVKLTDCGSKYGTSHKGNKIQANTEILVEDQDIIKFGVFQSIYKIEKVNIVTTGSGLSNAQKNALKKSLESIGGTLLNNWDSTCTYLTTEEVVLTIKALHALIDGKPFVTLEFWRIFAQNIKDKQPLPKIEDFKPKVAELLIDASTMHSNPKRRILFQGKTFVFPSNKIKSKMEDLILKTGGKCLSWEEQPIPLVQVADPKNKYIFIYSDEVKQVPDSLKNIYEHLKKLGQRTIPVQEIATAVMMSSCEKDCNPHFDRIHNVFFKEETESGSEMVPLAFETQSQAPVTQPKQEIIIPGSLDIDESWQPSTSADKTKKTVLTVNFGASTSKESLSAPSSSKRAMKESPENPFKKVKLNESPATKQKQIAVESKKRKADENLEMPAKKSSLKENPFAILRKRNNQIGSDNPFACLRVKQEKALNDNPFAKVGQSNEPGQTEQIVAENEPTQSSTTNLTYSNKSTINISEIKWMSRNSEDDKTVKQEIDEEFKAIYNKFKETVVIQVLPSIIRRVNLPDGASQSGVTGNGKNFKKFKKVRPVRPQNSIMEATVSRIVQSTSANEVTVLSDADEDDDDAAPAPRVVRKQVNKSRRFNF